MKVLPPMENLLINEKQLRELRRKALTIVGLPLGAVAVLFFYLTYTTLETHALNELTTVLTARTAGQASEFNTFCTRAASELNAAATFTAITETNDLETYRKLTTQTLTNLPLFSAAFIGFAAPEKNANDVPRPLLYAVRLDGEIFLRAVNEQHYFFQDWFLLAQLLEKPAWTDPYYNELSREMLIAHSVPLLANGKFIGVAGGAISIEHITEVVKKINAQGSQLILISDSGTVIVHPDPHNILRHTLISLANEAGNQELLTLARQLKKTRATGIMRLEKGIVGVSGEYVAYAPIANNGWTLLSVIPEEVVLSPLRAGLLWWIIYSGASGILLFVILYYLVTATLQKNLSHESTVTRARLFAEANLYSQSEFLLNVSHALRTPLNAIVGFANVAKFSDASPEVRKLLEGINKAAEGLTTIVANMLDFAQHEEDAAAEQSSIFAPAPNSPSLKNSSKNSPKLPERE